MICTGKSRILYALVQAQPNFMSDGGIFVRKWILLFLILVFADVFAISSLKEHVSLEDLRKAGIPVGEMEKAGISLEEMQLYLPFWQDMEFFPLRSAPQREKIPFPLRIPGWRRGTMAESGNMKDAIFSARKCFPDITPS